VLGKLVGVVKGHLKVLKLLVRGYVVGGLAQEVFWYFIFGDGVGGPVSDQ